MKLSKIKSLLIVFFCYLIAISSGYYFTIIYENSNLIITLLYADIIATIIIYIFSYIFKNASIYDPYWSVVPPFLLIYWFLNISLINQLHFYLLLFSVLFWSIRLTFNWIRGWKGFVQEDWRYIDLRNKSRKYYQLVNFLGIHLFPTLIVFICCIPFKFILESDNTTLSVLIGLSICFVGVLYEIISDQQLYRFKQKNSNAIIQTGLWKYSRHPNYYGEILFWWGLFIYGLGTTNYFVLIISPILMTLMFLYISIPWIEKKILSSRVEYKKYQKNVNVLIPAITFFKNKFK